MTTLTLEDIEKKARRYSDVRSELTAEVTELEDVTREAKREYIPRIKKVLHRVKSAYELLKDAIDNNRELFTKPKSKTFHGIKTGLHKQKGKVTFDDSDKVVKLIKKKFPEKVDILISTKEKPSKDALQHLTVNELKSLGCEITDTTDVVLIKATDSDIDKLVDALLKDEED